MSREGLFCFFWMYGFQNKFIFLRIKKIVQLLIVSIKASVKRLIRTSSFVQVGVAKNPKVQCTITKILTQAPTLETCQNIIESF